MAEEAKQQRRKPGPVPGPEKRQFTILIEPDLGEWAKQQPGGLSEMVRRLLREARNAAAGSRVRA
jgi:hypothetical protein